MPKTPSRICQIHIISNDKNSITCRGVIIPIFFGIGIGITFIQRKFKWIGIDIGGIVCLIGFGSSSGIGSTIRIGSTIGIDSTTVISSIDALESRWERIFE